MALTTLTRDQIIQICLNQIRGSIPGADTSEGSDYYLKACQLADVFRGNQGQAVYAGKQVFPITSSDPELTKHAYARGLSKQQPAGSRGKIILTTDYIYSEAWVTLLIEEGSTFTHADGTVYESIDDVSYRYKNLTETKYVGTGSSTSRILVSATDGVTDLEVGYVVSINTELAIITDVLTEIDAIDVAPPLSSTPSGGGLTVEMEIAAVAEIVCQTTGATTNKNARDTLTVDSPSSEHIETEAVIIELTGGGDIETADELRARMQSHDSQGNDGTPEYLRTVARETEEIRLSDAIVFPNYRGMGAHDILLIGVEGARMVGDSVIELAQSNIDENTNDDIQVKTIAYDDNDPIIVEVYPEPGYEKDWIGTTTTFSVDEVLSAIFVGLIMVQGDATATIEPGHRIIADINIDDTIHNIEIKKITVVIYDPVNDVTMLVFDTPLESAPIVGYGSYVYAAGPLTEPVTEAINTYLGSLGPACIDGSDNVYERHPTAGSEWPQYLRRSALAAACHSTEGVESADVISPTVDKLPTIQQVYRPTYIIAKYAV